MRNKWQKIYKITDISEYFFKKDISMEMIKNFAKKRADAILPGLAANCAANTQLQAELLPKYNQKSLFYRMISPYSIFPYSQILYTGEAIPD